MCFHYLKELNKDKVSRDRDTLHNVTDILLSKPSWVAGGAESGPPWFLQSARCGLRVKSCTSPAGLIICCSTAIWAWPAAVDTLMQQSDNMKQLRQGSLVRFFSIWYLNH